MDDLQQQLIFTAGALLCAGISAVRDIRERRIPNRITVPAMAAGLVLHWIAGGPRGLADAALAGLIAGSLFLVFFVAGGMGGGDVKLMAAVGFISGLSHLALIAIATAVAGGVFAIAVGLYHGRLRETVQNAGDLLLHYGRRGLKPHPDLNLANARTLRLPFAVPVAAGCLVTVFAVLWEAYS
jgi:prepilin peptidase CpaA